MPKKKVKTEEKSKVNKYKELQEQIFDYCAKNNIHAIVTDMMNKAFLNKYPNPTLYMANYLLELNNTSLDEQCLMEIRNLKQELADSKMLNEEHLVKIDYLQRRISALERQTRKNVQMQPQSSQLGNSQNLIFNPSSMNHSYSPTGFVQPAHAETPQSVSQPSCMVSPRDENLQDQEPTQSDSEQEVFESETPNELNSNLNLSEDSDDEDDEISAATKTELVAEVIIKEPEEVSETPHSVDSSCQSSFMVSLPPDVNIISPVHDIKQQEDVAVKKVDESPEIPLTAKEETIQPSPFELVYQQVSTRSVVTKPICNNLSDLVKIFATDDTSDSESEKLMIDESEDQKFESPLASSSKQIDDAVKSLEATVGHYDPAELEEFDNTLKSLLECHDEPQANAEEPQELTSENDPIERLLMAMEESSEAEENDLKDVITSTAASNSTEDRRVQEKAATGNISPDGNQENFVPDYEADEDDTD